MMTRKRLIGTALAGGVILVVIFPVQGCSSTGSTAGFQGALQIQALNRPIAGSGPDPAPRFDQPAEAMKFFLEQRLAPGMAEIPQEQLMAALRQIVAREKVQRSKTAGDSAPPGGIESWQSIGPGNIGGRTRAIVIDPVSPDTIYAAGVAGGIFKSIDGGASWLPTDDMMMNLAVSTLAMDPTDPQTLYAGTGEGFGSGSPFVRGLGIFKTTDAAATWTQLPGTVNGVPEGAFHHVNKVVVSPNDPDRVYAATRFGVWRSLDAGASWSVVLSNPSYITTPPTSNGCSIGCTDLVIRSDRDPDVLFAAFGSWQSDGLYRSDDGGDSWVQYTTPSYQGRMTLSIAPSDNDVVYLAMTDNGGLNGFGRIASIFRADNGLDFSSVLDLSHRFSPWLFSYVSIATGCYEHPYVPSQGWYDNVIAVDPLDPYVVWVGGINLYRSDDGAQTFGLAGYWFYYLQDPVPPVYIHPDQHTVVFHPDYDGVSNQKIYVGNDGGLFGTTNGRADTSQEECPIGDDPGPPPKIGWSSLNNGYGVTQFYHGDSAAQGEFFVGGAQDNGSSRVQATDTPNGWDMVYGGDGGYVAIDPTDSTHLFIEINGFPQILESHNGGDSFAPAINGITDTDGLFITPLAMDQSDPDVLWTGGSRPWRTTDGAQWWELAGPDFAGAGTISAIAIAPSDSNVIYLGFSNGYVARTSNGLDASPTWTVFSDGLFGGWVSSMAVDPVDPEVAYCSYSTYGIPHILRTEDGGASWNSIDRIAADGVPDIPVHWIAVRPSNSEQLFAATELGVFASDDRGASWQPANSGLAHTVVESLDFKDDDTLVAFTHGRGAFMATLAPSSESIFNDGFESGDTTRWSMSVP